MSTKNNIADVPSIIDWITTSSSSRSGLLSDSLILAQIETSCELQKNLLQEIARGIFALTIPCTSTTTSLEIKKISDRAQYSILSEKFKHEPLIRLPLLQLKNLCHAQEPCSWMQKIRLQPEHAATQVIFFYHLFTIEEAFIYELNCNKFNSIEKLSNKLLIISDGENNYPYNLSLIPAFALWKNVSVNDIMRKEIEAIKLKFNFYPRLYKSLKHNFSELKWQNIDGQWRYTFNGLTKSFDYASLGDDILAAKHETELDHYLKSFCISDLDSSSSFPTLSIRSPLYLKARPQSLSSIENGYVICAAKENSGKQSPVRESPSLTTESFNRWFHRASRYLFRHSYQARVIFSNENEPNVVALVGEQVASIAIFPKLIVGVLEQLNLPHLKSVRIIAHHEDVLTIASDKASWQEINQITTNAETLFKMVATDGADPLNLFEERLLPEHGVGSFHLEKVPNEFFELVDTATTMKQNMPLGRDNYLMGLAYECLHEWSLAVEQFQKALRQDSKDPDILNALGSSLLEIGQSKEALPFLKRAFDLLPEDPEVANNLGRISLECGLVNEAIGAFERAVRLSPGSAHFLANLGNGYLLARRIDDALEMLQKAVRCRPNFAPAHESLAHLYLQNGDESQAKKHALIAYKENPVDTNIANLLWRLTVGKKESSKS